MGEFVGGIVTILVLAYLIVFLSGEFHPRNQNWRTWLLVAGCLPLGFLALMAVGELIN